MNNKSVNSKNKQVVELGLIIITILFTAHNSFSQEINVKSFVETTSAATTTKSVNDSQNVLIRLMVIEGRDKDSADQHNSIQFDSNLKSVSSKLLSLPFRSYSLLKKQDVDLPINEKQELYIHDNKIQMRQLGAEKNKFCIWLRWDDESGMNLIDTRLHLRPGETMILGSDATSDSGVILALTATGAPARK